MCHQDPRSVWQAKASREPAKDGSGDRGKGAKPDAKPGGSIEGRLTRGQSQQFCQRCCRQKRNWEVHGCGMEPPKPWD
jgi:hypothetical protein